MDRLLNMSNDDNNGAVTLDENGNELFLSDFQPQELDRIHDARAFSTKVLKAAGATEILWSGLATTHMQGTCRMGADPATSVVDTHVSRTRSSACTSATAHCSRGPSR